MKRLYLVYIFILSVLMSVAINIGASPVAFATADDFTFSDFTADYYLTRDSDGVGHLKVSETFTAEFPDYDQNHGITREIPFTNNGGKNLVLDNLDDLQLFHNGVTESPYKISKESDYFNVYIGDSATYVHGTQQYQLVYEFSRVITEHTYSKYVSSTIQCIKDPCPSNGHSEEYTFQELYWDTNGTGWSQPFDSLTARVHVADDLLDALDTSDVSCYVGRYGASGSERCEVTSTDDGFTFTTSNLSAGENLTFDLVFAADTFTIAVDYDYTYFVAAICAVVAAIGFAIFAICDLYKKYLPKRNYYKSLLTPVQYTPSVDLTVAEAAALSLEKVKSSPSATLVEMAIEHKVALIKTGKKWSIHILDLEKCTSWQKSLLEVLSHKSDLKNGDKFPLRRHFFSDSAAAAAARSYKYSVDFSLSKHKFFESSFRKTSHIPIIAGAVVLIGYFLIVFIIGFAKETVAVDFISFGSFLGIAISSCALIVIATIINVHFHDKYSLYTTAGLDAANYYKGLRDYIKLAESDRLKFLQSVKGADTSPAGIVKLYEKLLPYAMIFGLEKSWCAELNKYYQTHDDLSPAWYSGVAYIPIRDFAAFGHLTDRSFSSSSGSSSGYSSDSGDSSSSSSSGSGGRGYSGGGGGGGGGGGW